MTKYYRLTNDSFWKIVDGRVYYLFEGKFTLIASLASHDVIEVASEISYKTFLLNSN